jgi:hypothetical protein
MASLNGGLGQHSIYLCVARGTGAAVQDLTVTYPDKKEMPPAGFHQVKHTPFGSKANLNYGSEGPCMYLCYRPQVMPVVRSLLAQAPSDRSGLQVGRFLALLTECLYSGDQKVHTHTHMCAHTCTLMLLHPNTLTLLHSHTLTNTL